MSTLEDVLAYMETATRKDLLKIRNVSTRLAYPPGIKRTTISLEPGAIWPGMSEPLRLAELLWFAVKDNYSFMKRPDLKRWADPIEKLNRIDGHDWKLIQKVIVWSTKDDFWKQNVRSGEALRRHFEKCLVKMQSTGALQSPVKPRPVRQVMPELSREVVDPNSPGYKRFQEMRAKLVEQKDINVQPVKEPRRP